jgi:ribosomal-protein-alanine N-acetyltransferase
MLVVRRGEAADLEAVGRIQAVSPEAAQWAPAEYLKYDLRVAVMEGGIAGFLVTHTLVEGESEVLNVAVEPNSRRCGVGRALFQDLFEGGTNVIYLEVRESNMAARALYKSLGFLQIGCRAGYYTDSPENAVVLKFHSC